MGLIARGVPSGASFGAMSTAAAGSGDHVLPSQYAERRVDVPSGSRATVICAVHPSCPRKPYPNWR